MPTSSDAIRAAFVKYWQDRDSLLRPSSSLVPSDDPTVLLTTAGMQQFVPFFLGKKRPPARRLTSVQKCFRTVDIDEVGDPSHLTFFEMLGNFSVNDYFKKEVIPWALDFLAKDMAIPRERLWVTVHLTDDVAETIWLQAGIPKERITRLGDEHNWWGPPGKSGPCGPDSEIYYQQDPGHGCGFPEDPPGCDCGRLEVWNLVFMEYFQDEQGVRTKLPRPNVDTGMGLERLTAVLNGLPSVYETDLFMPIIQAGASIAGVAYGNDPKIDYALRVLADHGRGMTFLIADGVVPGTGGREYVLRRIMRRAVRFGRRLGIEEPLLGRIADAVIERMSPHYPELANKQTGIRQVVENEEELFGRTLRSGTAQLERLIDEARARAERELPGERVFDLYQTFGFPPELTEEALREQGMSLDWAGYHAALEQERTQGQRVSKFRHAQHLGENEFPDAPETEFLAWSATSAEAKVLGLRADGGHLAQAAAGARVRLVLEASPFYPEGGGQVGDTGRIVTRSGSFIVEDTQFDGAGHIVHIGRVEEGMLHVDALSRAEVDLARRSRSMRHHTVTHLLHRALKDVLGEGTGQQGSLVSPDLARFDFNYPRPMTAEQLEAVSRIVNDRSMQDLPVHWEVMPIDQAKRTGATMMFGEKYGEEVRVVSIGEYSKELCGGTHTHHSGELGLAVIASESGIGSGKRRIVAYAGEAALGYYQQRLRTLETLAERVGSPGVEDVVPRFEALLQELDAARRELDKLRHQRAHEEAEHLASAARAVDGTKVVAQRVENADEETLKRLVDAIREDLKSGVVVLGTVASGKPRFVVGITKDLAPARLHAGKLLNEVARAADGGGGGRPDFATGGGGDPSKLGVALDHAYQAVQAALAGK